MARKNNKWSAFGLEDIQKSIKEIGKLPQKYVTKAARRGMLIAYRKLKKSPPTPYRTGALVSGILIVGERARMKGKKVYQLVMDKNKNDIFVKWYGENKSKRAYYPASQEFGFSNDLFGKVEGKHFFRDTMDQSQKAIERKIIETMAKEYDKIR